MLEHYLKIILKKTPQKQIWFQLLANNMDKFHNID